MIDYSEAARNYRCGTCGARNSRRCYDHKGKPLPGNRVHQSRLRVLMHPPAMSPAMQRRYSHGEQGWPFDITHAAHCDYPDCFEPISVLSTAFLGFCHAHRDLADRRSIMGGGA